MIDQDTNIPEADPLAKIKREVLKNIKVLDTPFLEEHFHRNPDDDNAEDLKNEFLEASRSLNLSQRFELSLTDHFRDIFLVRLASTNHDMPDESKRLYDEYGDLLKWFKEKTHTNEMNRVGSGRYFTYEIVGDPSDGHNGYRAIITRTRPLIKCHMQARRSENETEEIETMLYKEVVFSIPAVLLLEHMAVERSLTKNRGVLTEDTPDAEDTPDSKKLLNVVQSELTMRYLEYLLYGLTDSSEDDENGDSSSDTLLQRIRTTYYSATAPVRSTV